MSARGGRYFEANPEATRAIESYGRVPPNYLAHEFFNDTWQPFYSVDVMDEMAQAGASYIGSATLADNHPMLLVEDSATDALKNLPRPASNTWRWISPRTVGSGVMFSFAATRHARRPKRRARSTMR